MGGQQLPGTTLTMLPETVSEKMASTKQDGGSPPEPLPEPVLTCYDPFVDNGPGSDQWLMCCRR